MDTLVTFRLIEYFGRTRVTVVHSGFENLPADSREQAFIGYEAGRQRGWEVLRALVLGIPAKAESDIGEEVVYEHYDRSVCKGRHGDRAGPRPRGRAELV